MDEKLKAKVIVNCAGMLAIAVACYATGSGTPLWALILLSMWW